MFPVISQGVLWRIENEVSLVLYRLFFSFRQFRVRTAIFARTKQACYSPD
jgi:hypothetical protein